MALRSVRAFGQRAATSRVAGAICLLVLHHLSVGDTIITL
jgi:hypothetical protein